MQLKVLELFAGIGGASHAFRGLGQIMAAVDINQNAQKVYELNFRHPYLIRTIESLSPEEITSFDANTWWISAPCQPFTRRGNQQDDHDPRSMALLHLIPLLGEVLPENIFLENVVGFAGSRTHQKLVDQLANQGYSSREFEICPAQMGIPNRRPRFYLVASRMVEVDVGHYSLRNGSATPQSLLGYVEEVSSERFDLSADELTRHAGGLNIVSREAKTSNCFTSAYGRSLTRSGSYLREADGRVRRFSPLEISRLLGFQDPNFEFRFPEELDDRQLWRLMGNSISVFVVRKLLQEFLRLVEDNPGVS